MEKIFIKAWDNNKERLKEQLKITKVNDIASYESLVELTLEYIVNPEMEESNKIEFDLEKITCIDNGDYQGTQLYIIPQATYQPSEYEYIVTSVGYGSCSGCDSLLNIIDFVNYDECLNDSQVNDIMTLCLHLIQNMHWLERQTEQ